MWGSSCEYFIVWVTIQWTLGRQLWSQDGLNFFVSQCFCTFFSFENKYSVFNWSVNIYQISENKTQKETIYIKSNLVVLEKALAVLWTARRSNQSILKEISPEYSLEGLMLKLKLQYFGHLMWRADSFEKTWCWKRLKAGGQGDDRGLDDWMTSLTQWTWVGARSRRWWRTGNPGVLQSIGSQKVGHDWVTE